MAETYYNIISEAIKFREEKNIHRIDMLHFLLQLRSELKAAAANGQQNDDVESIDKIMSDKDIAAHAFIILLAGFESTSTSLVFTTYELALNPHIQERLLEEIDQAMAKCENQLSYEVLTKMTYLDMVMSGQIHVLLTDDFKRVVLPTC